MVAVNFLNILSLISVALAVVSGFNLTVLHTNDVHARLEEADINGAPCTPKDPKCFGGAPRIRTMVKQKRAQYPNSVLLDAGDQFQGTLWFFVFGGIVSSQFMNLIGYDAMALGNHEFDNGISGLVPFVENATFPVMASNVDFRLEPELYGLIVNSTVLNVAGEKVGVVGYVTTETAFLSSNTEDADFRDELKSVQEEVDRLTSAGIKHIIALGHAGYSMDLYLAKELRDVDIVVGGHTNTFLYTGSAPSIEVPSGLYPTVVYNPLGKPVLVVQDYAFGKYLGELHVTFDGNGEATSWWGDPVLLDESVQKDPEAHALLQSFLPKINEMKHSVVGYTHVDLMADRVRCRTTECNLGNLITDAMVHQNLKHADTSYWTDVGIAVSNAGGFRADIPAGPITTESVIFVQPFRNTVDIVEVTGQTLKEIFEFGASKWSEDSYDAYGGFLQVSGLQITYDIRKPVGHRVVDLKAVCTNCSVPELRPLNTTQVYKVLMSSYIATGGDGYPMLPDKVLKHHILGDLDSDILLEYIKSTSPIYVGLQGRIRHAQDVECYT